MQLNKYKVVVILVNYNSFEDTRACLESIKYTEGELPYVVVVDNKSTESVDLNELYRQYDLLHLIFNSENLGFGKGNNIGINWAIENVDFEYLVLLNNDTIIECSTLPKLVSSFSEDQNIGITTGKIFYESQRDLIWYGGGEINLRKGWPKITDFRQKESSDGAGLSRYVTFASGCLMMFTRESIQKLSGFDEDFFMYCEDLELCLRAGRMGMKIYYNSDAVLYHKVQGSFGNKENRITGMRIANPNLDFLFFHMKSNQWIAMKKNLFIKDFVVFNLFFWLEYVYVIFKFTFKGRYDFYKVGLKTLIQILKYS